jgi:hypothetical protein
MTDEDRDRAALQRPIAPPWVGKLVRFMDDAIPIPFTRYRIGLDAILGAFAPSVGDGISALSHVTLIWSAFRAGLPRVVFARMLMNVAIDALVGSVPILGDVFDVVFKANRRNLELLERVERMPVRRPTFADYAIVFGALVCVLLALSLPMIVLVLVISLVSDCGR